MAFLDVFKNDEVIIKKKFEETVRDFSKMLSHYFSKKEIESIVSNINIFENYNIRIFRDKDEFCYATIAKNTKNLVNGNLMSQEVKQNQILFDEKLAFDLGRMDTIIEWYDGKEKPVVNSVYPTISTLTTEGKVVVESIENIYKAGSRMRYSYDILVYIPQSGN